jgi:hypothetical protein
VRAGVATQAEVDQLYEDMRAEMQREDFRGLLFPLTAWGQKPAPLSLLAETGHC